MEATAEIWIAACAHRLHTRWRTVGPEELEVVAQGLWRDEQFRQLPPADAAAMWLQPVNANARSTNHDRIT